MRRAADSLPAGSESAVRHRGVPLVARYSWRADLQEAETAVLRAACIDPDEVELITGPTRVQRLVGATGMFCMPHYVHPDVARLWRDLTPGIVEPASVAATDGPERLFVSRRGGTRECLNQGWVEQLFREHGFEVVYPVDLPFADQVALFRGAEVVAGFAGSNMFQLMFTDPKPVVLLTSETYLPKNEELICAVLGHDLDVFWSVPADSGDTSSPFAVDPGREGRLLRDHLAGL